MATQAGVNASPLITLGKIGRLDLLTVIADEIILTEAVLNEVAEPNPANPLLRLMAASPWLKPVADASIPQAILNYDLGAGEAR